MVIQLTKFISIFCLLFFATSSLFASSRIDELHGQINEKNQEIEEIEKEIEKYQTEIDKASEEGETLKNEIWRLQTTANKLKAEISLTKNKISSANFSIEKLGIEIEDKNNKIENKKSSLAEVIRNLNEEESQSLLEILLGHDSLSDFFDNIERMEYLQKDINFNLNDLRVLKIEQENQQNEKIAEKNNLESLNIKFNDQKTIADLNKEQKNSLLKQTQNKESVYQKLLAERVEKQKALTEEIQNLENEIRIIIEPGYLPPAGSGVLKWPLDEITITQKFGWTPFALASPWIYPSIGHNGVDFRASIGTPVKSAKEGIVTDTGNTDLGCKGASYGKWVLIEHPNNLSTLYAHLSLIKVSKGDSIETGRIIGYSGDTGVTFGPHLHFGVFATKAVNVTQYKSKVCGTYMKLPLVALGGYLDPLLYL